MRSITYMMIAGIAVCGLLAPTALAADDDYAATNRSIKRNLTRARKIIVELSDRSSSEQDEKTIAEFVRVQKAVEKEQGEYAELVPTANKIVALIRAETSELNKLIRLYNKKCRRSSNSACRNARKFIGEMRAQIQKRVKARNTMRVWGKDLLKRTTTWRTALAEILKKLKEAESESAPLEELDTNTAEMLASSASAASSNLETASAGAGLAGARVDASRALASVPQGLAADQDDAPLTEEPVAASADAEWRWAHVRVKRRLGPFCWTECCRRKVRVAK